MKKTEVYDLESLCNLFTYTGYDVKEDKWYQFVICDWINQTEELYNHLMDNRDMIMVGFNNEAYDYPLLHHFINHYEEYKFKTGREVAQALYAKSQYLIEQQFTDIADKNKFIRQLDLYKIWHYNNKARMTSLKDLEIAMRMDNVEEMPLHHTHWCKEGDEVKVLSYNKNDVLATFKFLLVTLGETDNPLYHGKNKIKLRTNLTKKFKVNCLNLADVPIGEALMLNLYSRAIGEDPNWLKRRGGTQRPEIWLGECIPSWCNIKSKEFQRFIDALNNTTVLESNPEFGISIVFHNIKFDLALGGGHACCKSGVYESTDKDIIVDFDVSSLYPSVARSLGIYPEHLGPEFMDLYSQFIDDRIIEKHKPKDKRDNVLIEGYKLILNGTYGKSGEDKSFLYDPLYKYKTTIGGQCFICMWAERMAMACPELKFLQANTDGITIICPKDKLDIIREVNIQLTKETTLVIEEAFYNKMVIRDVNNYLAEYTDSTKDNEHIKLKGDFEIDKEFHKDPSMRIVPIALKNYFLYNIPIMDTLKASTDIFDFCLRLKTNSKSTPYFQYYDKENQRITDKKLNRTTRYYVSNSGGMLFKQFETGAISGVNVGYVVTLFNKYEKKDMKDYNINYNFYLKEANKIKETIEDRQLMLFNDSDFV